MHLGSVRMKFWKICTCRWLRPSTDDQLSEMESLIRFQLVNFRIRLKFKYGVLRPCWFYDRWASVSLINLLIGMFGACNATVGYLGTKHDPSVPIRALLLRHVIRKEAGHFKIGSYVAPKLSNRWYVRNRQHVQCRYRRTGYRAVWDVQ